MNILAMVPQMVFNTPSCLEKVDRRAGKKHNLIVRQINSKIDPYGHLFVPNYNSAWKRFDKEIAEGNIFGISWYKIPNYKPRKSIYTIRLYSS